MYKIRNWCSILCQAMEEIYRYIAMGLVLRVAAVVLPKSWATMVAKFGGFVLALTPKTGKQAYWDFRNAFGAKRWPSFRLAQGWLARPFVDHVVFVRICHNREKMDKWKIIEHNAAPIRSLMQSGQPLIVATGHFAREASICLYLARVLSPCLLGVVAGLPSDAQYTVGGCEFSSEPYLTH